MILQVEFNRGTNDTPKACPFYYTCMVVKGLENAPMGVGLCQEEAMASLIRQLKALGLQGQIKRLNKDNGESIKERNEWLAKTFPNQFALVA